MNKVTLESSNHSLINIPKFDGLATFKVKYNWHLKKPIKNVLKITLTPTLHLEAQLEDVSFKIMGVERKYRINIDSKLEWRELADIFNESARELIRVFNDFEKLKFGQTNEINISEPEQLEKTVSPLIDWFYSQPN